jgi:hypothetical protein
MLLYTLFISQIFLVRVLFAIFPSTNKPLRTLFVHGDKWNTFSIRASIPIRVQSNPWSVHVDCFPSFKRTRKYTSNVMQVIMYVRASHTCARYTHTHTHTRTHTCTHTNTRGHTRTRFSCAHPLYHQQVFKPPIRARDFHYYLIVAVEQSFAYGGVRLYGPGRRFSEGADEEPGDGGKSIENPKFRAAAIFRVALVA